MAHFWWVHLRKKLFFHNIGKLYINESENFCRPNFTKKIHLKIKTINKTLFVSSVKKNEGEPLKNFGISNYKHETVSVIQDTVRKVQKYFFPEHSPFIELLWFLDI